MSNQIALRVLTQPGDELICDGSYHINFFEASPTVDLAKVSVNAVNTVDGILRVDDIQRSLLERARWQRQYYRSPALIWLENTVNGHGGRIFPMADLKAIMRWADEAGMPIFIDGARILNAAMASGIEPREYGECATMLTICFAKGLGAPMGAVLMGSHEHIQLARRFRKWYGGGLHQSGIFASAALYAIENNIGQLALDNANALRLFEHIQNCPLLDVARPETNIVIFDIAASGCDPVQFVALMESRGLRLLSWRGTEIRCVTSNLVSSSDVEMAASTIVTGLDTLSALSDKNAVRGLAA